VLVAALLGFTVSAEFAFGDELALGRWAVLASPRAQNSGLADIVVAGMSRIDEIALVERDRLDTIAGELKVLALFAVAPQQRLRIGNLLNADALLLLSQNDIGDEPRVEAAIIDCRRGIRLTTVYLSADKAQLESTGAAVCQAARDTLARYADGVSQIVAVSPFVCRNIVHNHDYLQSGFAELVRTGCLALPGVAVVELDEARAIQQELALSEENSIQQKVPVFIDGEFKVTESARREVESVVIDVRIRPSKQQSNDLKLGPMPLSEARDYLLADLAKSIVDPDVVDKTSLEAQYGWLTSRATRFSELGVWEEAARLREAALLLRPDDVSLRVALLDNYRELFCEPMPRHAKAWNAAGDEAAFRRLLDEKATAYLAGLGHLEHLIRNENVDAVQAIEWTQRYGTQQVLGSPPKYPSTPIDRAYHVARRECLASVESAKERFLLEVFPRVLRFSSLPPADSVEETAHRVGMPWSNAQTVIKHRWHDVSIELMLRRSDRDCPNADDFDFILRMFTTRIPDGLRSHTEMVHFLDNQGRWFRLKDTSKWYSNRGEWRQFLTKLEQSDHKVAALHARYARLCPSVQAANSLNDEGREQLVDRIRRLQQDYEATLRSFGEAAQPTDGWLYSVTGIWLRRISPSASVPSAGPRRVKVYRHKEAAEHETGQLNFKEVDLRLITIDGGQASFQDHRRSVPVASGRTLAIGGFGSLRGVVRCGDRLDVLWGPFTLYLMRERGVVRETVRRNASTFRDVAWDGGSIWAATEQGEIWRVSDDGNVLVKISSEHGLLPSDHGLAIEPVSEGRLIASGSFGPRERGWCADIKCLSGQEPSVRVFHEATRVAQPSASRESAEPIADLCFIPTGMHRFESGDNTGRDVMLVGRKDRWHPLAVDLNTLEVSVFARRLRDIKRDSLFSSHGNTVKPSYQGVYFNGLPGSSSGNPAHNLCPTKALLAYLTGGARKVLQYDDWLYVPGKIWWRIHPISFESELLTPHRLPRKYLPLHRYDVSAHYGILAWDTKHLYQVSAN